MISGGKKAGRSMCSRCAGAPRIRVKPRVGSRGGLKDADAIHHPRGLVNRKGPRPGRPFDRPGELGTRKASKPLTVRPALPAHEPGRPAKRLTFSAGDSLVEPFKGSGNQGRSADRLTGQSHRVFRGRDQALQRGHDNFGVGRIQTGWVEHVACPFILWQTRRLSALPHRTVVAETSSGRLAFPKVTIDLTHPGEHQNESRSTW